MDSEIRVVVERDGRLRLEVAGVMGARCLWVTAFLEKELGEVSERQMKGDLYRSQRIILRNRITSGDTAA